MKNLQLLNLTTRGRARTERGKAKILPHSRPTTFTGRGKPVQGKAMRGGLSKTGQNCHPYTQECQKVLDILDIYGKSLG